MTVNAYTRDQWAQMYLDAYQNRLLAVDPSLVVDVGPGSEPWIKAFAFADVLLVQSNTALAISDSIPLDNMSLVQMRAKYGSMVPYNGDTKASGFLTLSAGGMGATLTAGATLSFSATGNLYQVTSATGAYANGVQFAVESVDPGAGQNLSVGDVLTWTSTPSGAYSTCVVFDSGRDGVEAGITGGRAAESAEEYRERIRERNATPPGHGNEGDVMALVEASNDHGVPVEKCWVFPAMVGPGTVGYAFTVKRDNYYQSRHPSSAQYAAITAHLASGNLPGDFSKSLVYLSKEDKAVSLSVSLDSRSAQWADVTVWPPYVAIASGHYIVTAATSPLVFAVGVDDPGAYVTSTPPSPGNTIAVFDETTGIFYRKKILTVSNSGPWSIVCDGTLGQSDTTFTPVVAKSVSPWFDAINDVAAAFGEQMAKLGPGEVSSYVSPDGERGMRQPRPYPDQFDSAITATMAHNVKSAVPVVMACSLLSPEVRATPGNAVLIKLLWLDDLSVHKAT